MRGLWLNALHGSCDRCWLSIPRGSVTRKMKANEAYRLLMPVLGLLTLAIPAQAHHRNVCASGSQTWRQLYNGKDLAGWKHVGEGHMAVEEGLIRTFGGMGLLYWTGGEIGNCQIRVVYRMGRENDNSGVFIRIPLEPREAWMPVNYGYEVNIDNHPERGDPPEDDYHYSGTLYSLTKALAKPGKPGPEWNTMEITLDGPKTIVVLNGVKVTDYRESDPVPDRKFDFEPIRGPRPLLGYIGLQNDKDDVRFKEVAIRPLNQGDTKR
jgi:hypothetical protein